MQLPQEHIDHIKTAFQRMSSIDDLLKLLNYSKKLVYGEEAIPFKLKQITWYSNPKLCKKRYTQFEIKKKSGEKRIIHAPVPGLKSIQKVLSLILQCVFEPHKAATGFVMGKSIVDNASVHIGSNYVYNIDLKDFFPSIDQARVWKCLQLKPFSLSSINEVIEAPKLNSPISYIVEKESTSETITYQYFNKIYQSGKRNYITAKGNKISYTIQRAFRRGGYIHINKKESDIEAIDSFIQNLILEKNYTSEFIALRAGVIEIKIDEDQKTLLPQKNIGLANIIASLCCTEMEVERKDENGNWIKTRKKVLPQGAPTSPVLTNVICQKLDFLLTGVGKRFGLRYSRYADDITFSSMHNVYQEDGDFIKEVNRIVTEQNFHIKKSKTRLQKAGYRQEVTGLLVNDKVNVQKRYIKELRMWLYYWERYGYERASTFFLQEYNIDKGHLKRGKPDMASVIRGKLDYLKMVKGETNKSYKKLVIRFNKVTLTNAILSSNKKGVTEAFKKVILLKDQEFQKELIKKEKEIIEKYANHKSKDNSIIIHDPIKTVGLLNKFTEDTYLKYTTHLWDRNKETKQENVSREFFYKTIKEEFYTIYKFQELQDIGLSQFYWTLADFIVGPNHYGWSSYKLKFGWYNKELFDFYIKNKDSQPGSFLVPKEFLPNEKIEEKYLKYFDDFIDVFKNEIQFRGNTFYLTIKKQFDTQLGFEYNVEYEGLKGIEIYTNTNQIEEAIKIIASNIRQRPEKGKNIRIIGKYKEVEKLFEIRIEDIGSFSNAPLNSEKLKLKNGKGQLKSIRDNLISLCDFSIESIFRDKGDSFSGYELCYLNKEESIINDNNSYTKKEVPNPIGFTYILRFYE